MQRYGGNLIAHLVRVGHQHEFRIYLNRRPTDMDLDQDNVVLTQIPTWRFWTQTRLALEAFVRVPDVLFSPATALPAIRRPGLQTVATVFDVSWKVFPEHYTRLHNALATAQTRLVVDHASTIIAVSLSTKADLLKFFNVRPDRVAVVYPGVDRQLFRPPTPVEVEKLRGKYGLTRDYIVSVGTLQPRKNTALLIEAFAASGLRCDLVLAGAPGWKSESIRQAPERFGVGPRIKFLGFVGDDELRGLYGGACAAVFPSLYEGFGFPILEAMACGTTVVTSDRSSMPEVGGDAVIYVDPARVESISLGLERAVDDSALRDALANRREYQLRKFTWRNAAEETLGILLDRVKWTGPV